MGFCGEVRLQYIEKNFVITKKKAFNKLGVFDFEVVNEVFEFAYKMTLGKEREQRAKRSGGKKTRELEEIFVNVFQGKLAEFGIHQYLSKAGIKDIEKPDLNIYSLGVWDSFDLEVNNKYLNIKSTKSFGNLLLLEVADWDQNGRYIPDIDDDGVIYDFFVLTRVGYKGSKYPIEDGATLMRKKDVIWDSKESLRGIVRKMRISYAKTI